MYSRASMGEKGCMNGPARTSRYNCESGLRAMNPPPPLRSIAWLTMSIACRFTTHLALC